MPGGRDVRRGRVAARRDRLLHGERRIGEAGAHAHPRAVVLQPAVDGTDGARAASSPTRSRSCRASTRSWARSTGERCRSPKRTSPQAREIVGALPAPEVGDPAARAPRAGSGRLALDRRRWTRSRSSPASPPAEVQGTCSFYTMFKRRPCGTLLVSVCTNVTCLVTGGPEILEQLEQRYADDDDVTVEEVECLAACGGAPAIQVNYEFHEQLTPETRGRRRRRVQAGPPHRRARSRERRV